MKKSLCKIIFLSLIITSLPTPKAHAFFGDAGSLALQIYSQFKTYWKERKYCDICRNETLNGRQCGAMLSTLAQRSISAPTEEQKQGLFKGAKARITSSKIAKSVVYSEDDIVNTLLNPARWDTKSLYKENGYKLDVTSKVKDIDEEFEGMEQDQIMQKIADDFYKSPNAKLTLLQRISSSLKGIFNRKNPKKYIGWLCKTHCQAKTKFPIKIGNDLFKIEIKEREGMRSCMKYYHQYPEVFSKALETEKARRANNIISVPVYTAHEAKYASGLVESIIQDSTLIESEKKFNEYFPNEDKSAYQMQTFYNSPPLLKQAQNRLRRTLAELIALGDRNFSDVVLPMIGGNGLPKNIIEKLTQQIIKNNLPIDKSNFLQNVVEIKEDATEPKDENDLDESSLESSTSQESLMIPMENSTEELNQSTQMMNEGPPLDQPPLNPQTSETPYQGKRLTSQPSLKDLNQKKFN